MLFEKSITSFFHFHRISILCVVFGSILVLTPNYASLKVTKKQFTNQTTKNNTWIFVVEEKDHWLTILNFWFHALIVKLIPCLLMSIFGLMLLREVKKIQSRRMKMSKFPHLQSRSSRFLFIFKKSHVKKSIKNECLIKQQSVKLFGNEQLKMAQKNGQKEESHQKFPKRRHITITQKTNECSLINLHLHQQPKLEIFQTLPCIKSLKKAQSSFHLFDNYSSDTSDKKDNPKKCVIKYNFVCESFNKSKSLPANLNKQKIKITPAYKNELSIIFQNHEKLCSKRITDKEHTFQASFKKTISVNKNQHQNPQNSTNGQPLVTSSRQRHQRQRDHQRMTRMLCAVLVLFLITELPQGLLALFCGLDARYYKLYYEPLGDLMDIIALVNNAVNFVLYCATSSRFRSTFVSLMCRKNRS